MRIIDAHIHIGANWRTKYYPPERMFADLRQAGVDGAVVFAFPEDIYRKIDTPQARLEANQYVLEVSATHANLCPFYFVWNDFIIPDNLGQYAGIKWHRHGDEPRYDYNDPRCERFISAMAELRLPVILEEEFSETVQFVNRVADSGITVIIPHMGLLNGGYAAMEPLLNTKHVCFDTSCAAPQVIATILAAVGPERILFGSDVSGTREPFFNFPSVERAKLAGLGLTPETHPLIFGGNLLRLVSRTPFASRLTSP